MSMYLIAGAMVLSGLLGLAIGLVLGIAAWADFMEKESQKENE